MKGWALHRFDEVFDLQMGKTPDRKTPGYFGGDNVWVSIRDMGNKEILDSNEHITDEAVIATNIRKVKKGTVIMSFKLTVGKCAIAARDLYTNEAIMAFNLKEGYDISADFLYYYLQGYKWEGANKAVMGLTLNKATISKHKIGFPSLSEQLSIVSELDKINELIGQKKSQMSDFDKLELSIFYDMFGDPTKNEKGWEVKNWSDVLTIINGKNQKAVECNDGDYPIYGSGGIMSYANNWLCPEDCIVIGRKGNINKPIFVHTKFWNVDTAFGLDAKRDILSPTYLYFSCLDYDFERLNKAVTIPSLTKADLLKISMPVPSLSLQRDFAKRIEVIEQQKEQISSTIKDLETLLASRMQYWFD